jgi:hypothetical protein
MSRLFLTIAAAFAEAERDRIYVRKAMRRRASATCNKDPETGLLWRSAFAAWSRAAVGVPHGRGGYGNAGTVPSDFAAGCWWDHGQGAQPPAPLWLCE